MTTTRLTNATRSCLRLGDDREDPSELVSITKCGVVTPRCRELVTKGLFKHSEFMRVEHTLNTIISKIKL
jgi:hypothetical protein